MKPKLNNKHDWAAWHDVIVEVLLRVDDPNVKKYCADDALDKIFDVLPRLTKLEAHHYGLSDTVFRESAYVWLVENWESVKEDI